VRGALALVAVAFLAAPVPASATIRQQEPSSGGVGIRLLDAPTSARDDPRARVYIVDHLAPGTTIARRVEVSNTTASPQSIAVYPSAATIKDGAFVGSAGQTANPLSTWTSVTPASADVPTGGKQTAMVTIAVPADAAPGEQYGVVWAEARSAAPAGGGVTQVSRVGIRLYIDVGAGGAPAPEFAIDSLTAARSPEGKPVISAAVHNTGGRALDMSGTLRLADGPGGLSAGPFNAELGKTLAVGDSLPVTIALDDRLPAGPWLAQVTLKSGLVEHTAEATVTFPDSGSAAPVPVGEAIVPWLWVTLAAAAVGITLLAYASLVHRR
jgi:hypothetical protein